jgi:hypothetical protein
MIYYTHNNFGRHFKVIIKDKQICVYKFDHITNNEHIYNDTPILEFKANKIFIGKSHLNKITKFSGGYGKKFDGNSILCNVGDDNTYIYIGDEIYSFKSKEKIIKYYSLIGNSDVSFGYAIDELKNYYLMNYHIFISNNNNINEFEGPFQYYRDMTLITTNIGTSPPTIPIQKILQNISAYYFGKKRYTLWYVPVSECKEFYNRLCEWNNNKNCYHLIVVDDEKIKLSFNEFKELMEYFEKESGFHPFKYKIIHKGLYI